MVEMLCACARETGTWGWVGMRTMQNAVAAREGTAPKLAAHCASLHAKRGRTPLIALGS